MINVTDSTFYSNLGDGLNIIDFYTDYCQPCKELSPTLERLSQNYNNVKFLKVNATENRQLSKMFRVMSAPTLIFYKDNNVVNVIHGLRSEEDLRKAIEQSI